MTQNINPIQLLQEASDGRKTGYLQVIANSVIWELHLTEGKLQYAYHSLQPVEAIQHCLLHLGHAQAAKVVSVIAQHIPVDRRFAIHVAEQLFVQN